MVGGGLVGCVLAVYLAKRGHQISVFERHADPRTALGSTRSAVNITLCERGLRALAAVGMRDRVSSLCVPVHGRRIHGLDDTVAYQPYGNRSEAIYSISRSDLNKALIELAEKEQGVQFHFGQKCVHVELARATAHFEDTHVGTVSQIESERLFGADGAYSTVRLHMQKTEYFNYSQQYWSQCYTSVRIPPRPGGEPILESGTLHIWPRGNCMLIAFPNRDCSVTASLLIPRRGENSRESLSTAALMRSFFHALFRDAVRAVPDLPDQFFAEPVNSLLTVRCDPWSCEDKVLLIGDAAHAILPSYGQGANAGFEDCSILDGCIERHGTDWGAAFRSFESERKASMDTIADLCIEHFTELCDLVGDPKFLRRREIERRLEELHPDLYQPLYSMVSFGFMSYADAIRVDRRQRALVDHMMEMDEIDDKIDGPEVRKLLNESVRRAG
ncbi:MAG TPA: NAD(P)/FAD-dependent oxidoreductase [Polyangiaceae bacterium]|nr:NAD(P)/FAD-dependent oxidoreductase [Polyangiaceae bacterium]